jgi:chromosome segregation ATPase
MSSIEELKKQIEKKAKIQKEIIDKKYDEKIKEFKTNYKKAFIEKEEEEKKNSEENFKNEENKKILYQKQYNLLKEEINLSLKNKREKYNKLKDDKDLLNVQIKEYTKKIEDIIKQIAKLEKENVEVKKNIEKLGGVN